MPGCAELPNMVPDAIPAFFRRRWITKNASNPITIITPAATPTPIPAFAPDDKPVDADGCSDGGIAPAPEVLLASVDVSDALVDIDVDVGVEAGVDEDS